MDTLLVNVKDISFYVPNHSPRIEKISNAKLLENGEVNESASKQVVDIQEIRVEFFTPINVLLSTTTTNVVPTISECPNNVAQHLNYIRRN